MTKLKLWWKQWRCEHYWRPALLSRLPGRYREFYGVKVCDYCEKRVQLSDAEFYAQFGRMPIL